MAPVVVGLRGGLVASPAAGHLLAGLLYGVTPVDTVTITSVVLTLAANAALASSIPARRGNRLFRNGIAI